MASAQTIDKPGLWSVVFFWAGRRETKTLGDNEMADEEAPGTTMKWLAEQPRNIGEENEC